MVPTHKRFCKRLLNLQPPNKYSAKANEIVVNPINIMQIFSNENKKEKPKSAKKMKRENEVNQVVGWLTKENKELGVGADCR